MLGCLCARVTVFLIALLPVVPLKLGHTFDFALSLLEDEVLIIQLGLKFLTRDANSALVLQLIVDSVELRLILVECGLDNVFEVLDLLLHLGLALLELLPGFGLCLLQLLSVRLRFFFLCLEFLLELLGLLLLDRGLLLRQCERGSQVLDCLN